MSKIESVLFDWAGVMAPDMREPQQLISESLQKEGLSEKFANSHVNECVHRLMRGAVTEDGFWLDVASATPNKRINITTSDAWDVWTGAEPIPEMLELVEVVRSLGMRAIVFSNVLPPCKAKIEQIGGYDLFSARVLSCDEKSVKPEDAIYNLALSAAKSVPMNCVFIDDVAENLIPAARLGMSVIQADTVTQVHEDLLSVID